jgi:transposase
LPDAAQLAALLHPPEDERPAQEQSCVTPFQEQVRAWRQQGVEGQAIYQLLIEQHGFAGSYSAVKRFLRRIEPRAPRATIRLEVAPGAEAQVDFGTAGLMRDPDSGRVRRAWAFVMTLSYSRHQYVEFVFDQTVATWCRCHRAAFEWFAGVPRRLVIDKDLRRNNYRRLSLPTRSNHVVPVAMELIAQQIDRRPLFVRDLSAYRIPTPVQAAGDCQPGCGGGPGDQIHDRRIVG